MTKKLTTFEAACLVAGNGIGGGLMALPYLSAAVGVIGTFAVLLTAGAFTVVLHIFLADMLLTAKNGSSLVSVMDEFLFTGKWKKTLTTGFFVLIAVACIFNIAAYVVGAADIITGLLDVPPLASKLIFYAVAMIVPALGIRALGLSEKMTISVMLGFVAVLFVVSMISGDNALELAPQSGSAVLALYGLAMFSFSALVAVPSVVDGLDRDAKSIKKAVWSGVGMNLFMSFLICVAALYASETVTEVAIVGWGEALGRPMQIVSSLLVLFAMLTSFWAVSFALSDMVGGQLKGRHNQTLVYLCTSAPCLLIAAFAGADFISFLGVVGGAM
ncbi:MAG: hypothetical protein LIO46_03950, partial [Clostridiales bacterium]|nr:hypothetical protein [Clostridiales bacterium]